MRVGFVGGIDRAQQHYERRARDAGHEVMFHEGHINGGGGASLARLLDSCDLVIIVTDVNSHGAVRFARQHLRRRGKEPMLVRKLGLTRFGELLDKLAA